MLLFYLQVGCSGRFSLISLKDTSTSSTQGLWQPGLGRALRRLGTKLESHFGPASCSIIDGAKLGDFLTLTKSPSLRPNYRRRAMSRRTARPGRVAHDSEHPPGPPAGHRLRSRRRGRLSSVTWQKRSLSGPRTLAPTRPGRWRLRFDLPNLNFFYLAR